jgi:hypothetical protein
MKTGELTGAALDWAVAKCEDEEVSLVRGQLETRWTENGWKPSTDWSQGGPIVEREGMDLNPHGVDSRNGRTHWRAAIQWLDESDFEGIGPTPLIAAMRCYVASKLGDNVDIPEELK